MPANLATRRVLLLGAGALGSAVGEVLVRAGVHDIAVLDGEMLQVGNLSRHTLGVPSIGKPKASTLADRLNNASPNAKVTGIDTPFPPKQAAHLAMARACDLVIDCTGSDAALYEMERFAWQDGTLFVSLSVGKHARRVYCFTAHGRTFPRVAFERLIAPWLQKERDEYKDDPLPWEGIGCWSPIFPARSDDIWLLASSAAKYLAEVAGAPPHESDIVVFEQEYADDDQTFLGVYRIMGGGAGA